MPASKSSASSRRSEHPLTVLFAALALFAAAAAAVYAGGYTLYYGDAEAHLNIARRLVDNRTPGIRQFGTTWLPLPHLLMAVFVRVDSLWRTGLAGAMVSVPSMAIATAFLYAAVNRLLGAWPAIAAAAVFALNPNLLYLSGTPMTEPLFLASLCGLLYFTVRLGEKPAWPMALGAGAAALAGTLTRYEMWFLLPFVAVYILLKSRSVGMTSLFCLLAAVGPALWLAHNRWQFGDALYFYRGPWSALAIAGKEQYPGRGDWQTAARYYFEAVRLAAGWPAVVIAAIGSLAVRRFWPWLLLALPAIFYIWSLHSSGTPVYVPTLRPFSFYNTRYALPLLPLVALTAGALARFGKWWALAIVAVTMAPLALEMPITWRESDVNSRARREWTTQAATYLAAHRKDGESVFTSFGDMTGIFRQARVPLRLTLTGDNDTEFDLACARPDVYLHATWAVAQGGDAVQTTVDRARLRGPRYQLQHRIMVKGAPVIEIYRRIRTTE